MKKIECIIRSERLHLVEQALRGEQVGGMTISEVKGFGRQRQRAAAKVKVEIYAIDMEVDKIVQMITQMAYSGKVGDGKIAILPLDNVIRIRTQEEGAKALV